MLRDYTFRTGGLAGIGIDKKEEVDEWIIYEHSGNSDWWESEIAVVDEKEEALDLAYWFMENVEVEEHSSRPVLVLFYFTAGIILLPTFIGTILCIVLLFGELLNRKNAVRPDIDDWNSNFNEGDNQL